MSKKRIDAAVLGLVLFGVLLGGLVGEAVLAVTVGLYVLYSVARGVAWLRARRAEGPDG
jgi:energy-converting hydrogenase Eha subunit G